jgi:hypothetical protein
MVLFVAVSNLIESCSSICFAVLIADLGLVDHRLGSLDDLNCVLFGAVLSSMGFSFEEGGTVKSGCAAVSFLMIAVGIR